VDLGQELPQHGPGIMHDQFICSSGQFLFSLVFSLGQFYSLGNPVTNGNGLPNYSI
jgi:hypothetical protein